MASKQKIKGSGFERIVAKELTQRYGENFTRTIGSGAFTGGKNMFRKETLTENQIRHHKGDVTPPDSFFKMNMECKSYKDFPFHLLFTGKCAILDSWLDQTLEAADEGDINIVVIKINNKGKYVCIEKYNHLDISKAMNYKDDWYFFNYDVFFELNHESFKEACGKD